MIVRDAEDVIEGTLAAIRPYIDRWYILDTGSIDDTKELIKNSLRNVEGHLYEEPFVDFGSARNSILDKAGTECKYVLMLDDSYELIKGGEFIRPLLTKHEVNCLTVQIISENRLFLKSIFILTTSQLRFKYRVHEILEAKTTMNMPPEILFRENIPKRHKARTKNRLSTDIHRQLADLKDYPNDPRVVYYIGQTYSILQQWDDAEEWYTRRTYLFGGFLEDAYNAHYKLGLIKQYIRRNNDCVYHFLKASELMHGRAEPYFSLSEWFEEKNPVLAYFLADSGKKLPNPPNCSLYEAAVYDIGLDLQIMKTAHKVKRMEQGKQALLAAYKTNKSVVDRKMWNRYANIYGVELK
jgi:hypothetical protein